REEALHRGVVPNIARSAHRADDAMVGHEPLELLAGVLAAAILDQPHSLKLELAGKLPSLHDPPPVPSKTPNSVSSEPGAGQTARKVRSRPCSDGVRNRQNISCAVGSRRT